MLRLAIATGGVVAVLAAPAAALAADARLESATPDGRAVVLSVRDTDGTRCLTVAVGGGTPQRTSACAPRPADAHATARALHVVYRARPEKIAVVHGVAAPGVDELRVTLADRRQVTVRPDPESGAYLEVLGGRPPVATVRALEAGVLRGAADLDPRFAAAERGPFRLRRTRDERGAAAYLTAFTARLYRERSTRRARHACVGVAPRRPVPASSVEPGYSGGSACTTSSRRVVVRYAAGCTARRLLLFGIVPTAVRRLTLVTASGRRIPAALSSFSRQLRRSGRGFVVSMRDPGALARLDAYGRKGRRLASLPLDGTGSGCASSARS